MNDKTLADAIVGCGVGQCQHRKWYGIDHSGDTAEDFVRDWRVAGAMMEKMDGELLIWPQKYSGRTDVWIVEPEKQDTDARNESLPRAINEACVGALK